MTEVTLPARFLSLLAPLLPSSSSKRDKCILCLLVTQQPKLPGQALPIPVSIRALPHHHNPQGFHENF